MERTERHVEIIGDYKNTLPGETDERPDSGMPRELRTHADAEGVLTRREADVAGISQTPDVVYGDTDENQNAEDVRDAHQGPAV